LTIRPPGLLFRQATFVRSANMDQIPYAQDVGQSGRKPYATPALADLGSFAEITQGGVGPGVVEIGIYS
jgi:hypothetical protein